jgi:hypothetical protein
MSTVEAAGDFLRALPGRLVGCPSYHDEMRTWPQSRVATYMSRAPPTWEERPHCQTERKRMVGARLEWFQQRGSGRRCVRARILCPGPLRGRGLPGRGGRQLHRSGCAMERCAWSALQSQGGAFNGSIFARAASTTYLPNSMYRSRAARRRGSILGDPPFRQDLRTRPPTRDRLIRSNALTMWMANPDPAWRTRRKHPAR